MSYPRLVVARMPVASLIAILAYLHLSLLDITHAAQSDWRDLGGGKVRLLATVDPASNKLSGGIEVRLKPGWKTYWRYPGSSGIPPKFDFSSSNGIAVSQVSFPAPSRLGENDAAYAGYENSVTFPFSGQINNAKGSRLELSLVIGLCEEICIPARAQLAIETNQLMQSDRLTAGLIDLAWLSVPKTVPAEMLVSKIRDTGNGKLEITISKEYESDSGNLFVEGPENWYLTPATKGGNINGQSVFYLDISRAPSNTDIVNADLKYTLVSSEFSVQTE